MTGGLLGTLIAIFAVIKLLTILGDEPTFWAWIDYGPAGIATLPQDGWDAWGLLIALLVVATVTLVVLVRMTEVEMSEDVPWEKVTFGLGCRGLRARRPEEPHRRQLDLGELCVRRHRRRACRRDVPELGRDARQRGDTAAGPSAKTPRVQLSRLTSSTRSSPGPS